MRVYLQTKLKVKVSFNFLTYAFHLFHSVPIYREQLRYGLVDLREYIFNRAVCSGSVFQAFDTF